MNQSFIETAIELAKESESEGNLPIGAVLSLGEDIVAVGRNRVYYPRDDQTLHAEIQAIGNVPDHLRDRFSDMLLTSTLEPCPMCFTALILQGVRRIKFGFTDNWMGASLSFGKFPPLINELSKTLNWEGPIAQQQCEDLFDRVKLIVNSKAIQ